MKDVGEEIGKAVRSTSTWLAVLVVIQLVNVLQFDSIQLFQAKELVGRLVRIVWWTLAVSITWCEFHLLLLLCLLICQAHIGRHIAFQIALQIAEQKLRLIFELVHELKCSGGRGRDDTRGHRHK